MLVWHLMIMKQNKQIWIENKEVY